MQDFLKSLSKHTLAIIILVVAVLFVVISDPPVTVCRTQVDDFLKSMVGELTLDPKKPLIQTSTFQRHIYVCKTSNSVGGCLPLFTSMRRVLDKMKLVSLDCRSTLAGESVVRGFLTESIKIIVRLAWGETPPKSAFEKNGWLEVMELALFCRLQREYVGLYSEASWGSFRESMMKDLPQIGALDRAEVWNRSILSTNCGAY
jgi:hypothetical protein